jgi:hypothetical protein
VTEWKWAVGPTSGPVRELATTRGRTLTARVDAAFSAQFTLDGDGDEIRSITPLAADLWCWRNSTLIFRGRICGWQGTLNAKGHAVQFSALDYRGMLNRRVVGAAGAHYSNTDQAAIAWGLINTSQALSGGAWGVTNGVGSSSAQNRDANWDPGKPIGDAISELGRLTSGFEWEISPTLALNRWYPRRGVDAGVKLDYGGMVVDLSYSFDPTDYANAVLVTGDQTTTPVAAASATIGTDPRGRWEIAQGYSGVVEQTTLAARAPWLLGQTAQIRPDYRVKLKPGRWAGPSALWVGDTVYPSFKHGWLTENGSVAHRAVEVQIVLDGDGGEEVQLGLLAVPT